MAVTTHNAFNTIQTALSTEWNTLANNANTAASGNIDNTTALELYLNLELLTAAQGAARSAGAMVAIYIVHSLDGTNFDDVNETTAEPFWSFSLDATVTARRRTAADLPIPPGLFRLFGRNLTGQAFAASGSTLRYRTHSIRVL